MSSYKTVVVGTDGSDSSLRAVDRAGALASGPDAKLVIATAYFPSTDDSRAADVLIVHIQGMAIRADRARIIVMPATRLATRQR